MNSFMVNFRYIAGKEDESARSFEKALNKKIKTLEVAQDPSALFMRMQDDSFFRFADEGQSCCENRYMRTDDDLSLFVGATLVGGEIREGPNTEDEDGVHEVEFLVLKTDRGDITFSNHNEHSGYYGGFSVDIKQLCPWQHGRDECDLGIGHDGKHHKKGFVEPAKVACSWRSGDGFVCELEAGHSEPHQLKGLRLYLVEGLVEEKIVHREIVAQREADQLKGISTVELSDGKTLSLRVREISQIEGLSVEADLRYKDLLRDVIKYGGGKEHVRVSDITFKA